MSDPEERAAQQGDEPDEVRAGHENRSPRRLSPVFGGQQRSDAVSRPSRHGCFLVVVLLTGTSAGATLLPVKWESLAATSPVIVVGKVSGVHEVQGHRVADLKVERVVRGDPRMERALFLAEPAHLAGFGSDDSTTAEPGEDVLLFLESGERYLQTELFWRQLRRLG